MIWLGFIGSAAIVGAFFAQGYHFGYKAAKAEDEHHDLTIENGYLKLLGARMGEIRAAHKGIQRLRRRLDATQLKLRRAGRPLEEREAPHCPTCECGGEPQIRQLCPECLGYMPCAQHPSDHPRDKQA